MAIHAYIGKNAYRKINRIHDELRDNKININKAKLYDIVIGEVQQDKIIKKLKKARMKDINNDFWHFDM